jgi:hypothetical protein
VSMHRYASGSAGFGAAVDAAIPRAQGLVLPASDPKKAGIGEAAGKNPAAAVESRSGAMAPPVMRCDQLVCQSLLLRRQGRIERLERGEKTGVVIGAHPRKLLTLLDPL